jgi:hypothetical protein
VELKINSLLGGPQLRSYPTTGLFLRDRKLRLAISAHFEGDVRLLVVVLPAGRRESPLGRRLRAPCDEMRISILIEADFQGCGMTFSPRTSRTLWTIMYLCPPSFLASQKWQSSRQPDGVTRSELQTKS